MYSEALQTVQRLAPEARAALLTEALRVLAEDSLADYKPYPKQKEFHASGGPLHVRERLLKAGNQVGKCVSARTLIDLANGTRVEAGELYRRGKPFCVMAWTGSKAVPAMAVRPIKKPAEPMVRVWMEDGRWFECALNHRVLTLRDGYCFVERLLSSWLALPASSSEFGLITHVEDVRRWLRSAEDSLARCSCFARQCGGRLHSATDGGRSSAPEQVGALPRSPDECSAGARASKRTSIGQPSCGPPSSSSACRQSEAPCVEFSSPSVCRCARRTTASSQAEARPALESEGQLRSTGEVGHGLRTDAALVDPVGEGNRIIAYQPIPRSEVYDFTVPEWGNYITAGVVHHNTWSAGFEHAMHLTGRYPDWWPGATFDEPTIGWAASETGQTTRDTVQRILLGQVGSWGTGAIPKDAIIGEPKRAAGGVPDLVETILVRHGGGGDVQAGTSRVTIKTYDQGRLRWQGETLDWVWFDEEPPEDIYFEGLTRTNARGGIVTLTFTPLKGMSEVVRRFLQEKPAGTVVTNMTIHDASHYTPEQRAAIIATYPAHEREARINGTPTLGSGRIFQIADEVISEPAIQIPPHWPRICGMDFGWDHPTAAVWIAWDRETDTVHLYDAYRVKEATPAVHSLAIAGKGKWIPVAWPHDGLQHDKGSGEALRSQYQKLGVNMLPEKATHAPDEQRGQKEGEGGNGVEAGLMMMLDRMQGGKLKVAAHLNDWWEEFRLYHRKDGKVVKEADDLMSATRYALMMLRHAKVPAPKQRTTVPGHEIQIPATGLLG